MCGFNAQDHEWRDVFLDAENVAFGRLSFSRFIIPYLLPDAS
jgi:hypothetical protein